MNVIVYDTETSGLPIYKEPSESPGQPHIVEICGLLYTDGALIDTVHRIIKPDGWTIPDEVAAIHGITTERAMDEGIPESEALAEFLAMHACADLRVAHNEPFDQRILRIAIKRFGTGMTQEQRDQFADDYKATPAYCTMKASTKPCALPGNKWPKLTEAYKHFFGETFEGAHGALADATACARLYFRLQEVA